MEVTKRTYQKHKTEKKITVKHYYNTYNKEITETINLTFYPIYVQVTYNRQNAKFKTTLESQLFLDSLEKAVPYIDGSFKDYYFDQSRKDFDKYLARDIDLIQWLVNECIKINSNFHISVLPNLYHSKIYEISSFIEWCLKKEIEEMIFNILSNKENSSYASYDYTTQYNVSSLTVLEFYRKSFPQLITLREKYNSQIWTFKIFVQNGNDTFMVHGEPMFILPKGEGAYSSQEPTLRDYTNKLFQKRFKECFKNEEIVTDILSDLETLFLKYYDTYIDERLKYFVM